MGIKHSLPKAFAVTVLSVSILKVALAATVPAPVDPWKAQDGANCDGYGQCRVPRSVINGLSTTTNLDEIFTLALQVLSLPSIDDSRAKNLVKEKLQKLALEGDLRAKLVYFGQYMPMSGFGRTNDHDAQVLKLFDQIDRVDDPRMLYELAKLMQLRRSLCLNVLEVSGIKTVEQRCSSPYNEGETNSLQRGLSSRYVGYFLKSAEGGYGPSQYELGRMLLKQSGETSANQSEIGGRNAMEWITLASSSVPEAEALISEINSEKNKKLMADKEERKLKEERERTKPRCEFIRFTGIASAAGAHLIDKVSASSNIEDTLARNPIKCDRRGCYGVSYFKNHKGRIETWDKEYFVIASPVDFDIGRRDIFLTIKRVDAICQK